MPKKQNENDKNKDVERVIDLLERLGTVMLYLSTNMNHHGIARKLHMQTYRVTTILKGLKKRKK